MTRLLAIDPGKNTGVALGFYDATTPFRLLERWQVHGGAPGFIQWWRQERPAFDELVIEKFVLSGDNDFTADLTPVEIEGALLLLLEDCPDVPVWWQARTAKASLTGYPRPARTRVQRQRVRFDFLDRFGMFKSGTENDDSNDAVVHALVNLKLRKHLPTMRAYWPGRPKAVA